jgi:hypothetical protein
MTPKPRVILNGRLAAEIYAQKLALEAPATFDSCLKDSRDKMKGMSAKVSKKYGVSAKTIRDIWNRKTWTNATRALWISHNSLHEVTAMLHLRMNLPLLFRIKKHS